MRFRPAKGNGFTSFQRFNCNPLLARSTARRGRWGTKKTAALQAAVGATPVAFREIRCQRTRQATAGSTLAGCQPLALGCACAPGRSRFACSQPSRCGRSRGESLKRSDIFCSRFIRVSWADQLPLSPGFLEPSCGAGRPACRLGKGQACPPRLRWWSKLRPWLSCWPGR